MSHVILMHNCVIIYMVCVCVCDYIHGMCVRVCVIIYMVCGCVCAHKRGRDREAFGIESLF